MCVFGQQGQDHRPLTVDSCAYKSQARRKVAVEIGGEVENGLRYLVEGRDLRVSQLEVERDKIRPKLVKPACTKDRRRHARTVLYPCKRNRCRSGVRLLGNGRQRIDNQKILLARQANQRPAIRRNGTHILTAVFPRQPAVLERTPRHYTDGAGEPQITHLAG